MKLVPMLVKEMEMEAGTTRKMLSIIPDDKFDWKPHEKSMTVRSLATHIAELGTWITMTINTSELDFAAEPYNPTIINSTKDLVTYFEKCTAEGIATLEKATEAQMDETWTLRNGTEVYMRSTKAETIRHTFCQIVHHRAQLGVYMRLLNVAIPGSYGPSADEQQH